MWSAPVNVHFDLQHWSKDVTFWRILCLLCHPNRKHCLVPCRRPRSLLKDAGIKQRDACVLPLAVSPYSWLHKRACGIFLRLFPNPARSVISQFRNISPNPSKMKYTRRCCNISHIVPSNDSKSALQCWEMN